MVTALAMLGIRLNELLARELLLFGVTGATLIVALRSVVRDRALKLRLANDEVAAESCRAVHSGRQSAQQ